MVACPDHPISAEEARMYYCAKCGATKGSKCTYLTHSVGYKANGEPIREVICRRPGILDRYGQPMDTVHVERTYSARRARRESSPKSVDQVSGARRAAFNAMVEFSRREYVCLGEWLREYYWILTGTLPDTERAARYVERG